MSGKRGSTRTNVGADAVDFLQRRAHVAGTTDDVHLTRHAEESARLC